MRVPDGPESSRTTSRPHQRLFAELKRRRVFRVTAVYGGVALLVMEVANTVFPAIPLPPWSTSLVLWLLILGFPVAIVLAWAFELTPEGIVRTESADPEELEAIVALPASRRWPSGVLALLGLVALGGAWWLGREGARRDAIGEPGGAPVAVAVTGFVEPSEDTRPSIAVLPLTDLSAAGDQEYFSDGITEELLAALARIRGLRVAARTSAFAYKDRSLDLREVGRELGVRYILEGSVRKDGPRLRVTAQLVEAADGFHLWSESYDRELGAIFEIQRDIAESIARSLEVPLGLTPAERLVLATEDLEAHDLYLSGRAAMRARGTRVAEAIELFERAAERDSLWAPAWAGLAESRALYPLYAREGRESTDSVLWAESLDLAERAARRALELDPRNASAHAALGGLLRDRWVWAPAEEELRAALSLDPDNYEAYTQYAELLWGMGRSPEAVVQAGRALALDRAPIRIDTYGYALYQAGRTDEAVAMWEEGLAADPSGEVHFLRTLMAQWLLLHEGRWRDGLDKYAAFLPDTAAYRIQGQALEARNPALLAPGRRYMAQTWMLLDEPERALDELEAQAFAMPFRVQFHLWDPILAPLRTHPRFRDVILPRLNLAEPRTPTP